MTSIAITDGFSTIYTTSVNCGPAKHDHTIQCVDQPMQELMLKNFKYAREQHAWRAQGWRPWGQIEFEMYFPPKSGDSVLEELNAACEAAERATVEARRAWQAGERNADEKFRAALEAEHKTENARWEWLKAEFERAGGCRGE